MKVKLPKNVCEAIEEFRRCGDTDCDILTSVLGSGDSKASSTIRNYIHKSGGFYNVLKAITDGFEPIEEDITIVVPVELQQRINAYYEAKKGHGNWKASKTVEDLLFLLDLKGVIDQ